MPAPRPANADRNVPDRPAGAGALLLAWAPWALLLMALLGVAGLGMLYSTLRAENALLREQQRLLEAELRSTQQRAEAERIVFEHELAELRRKAGVQ